MKLHASGEDYLETILVLHKKTGMVRSVDVAEKIYERHCFFTEQLIAAGVDPETAEVDACRIEHVISNENFERLKEVAPLLIQSSNYLHNFIQE